MTDVLVPAQSHPSRATDHLLRKMWKTKSARFNAQARLMNRHWLSVVATSALACYLIAASILQLTIPAAATGDMGKIVTSAVLIMSVFLLMITLTESARNYASEADRMHKSALEIAELYNRFQALDLVAADQARGAFNDQYSAVLKGTEVNHKDIDFLRFQIGARHDLKPSPLDLFLMLLQYVALWLVEYFLYFLMILGPLAMLLALINRAGITFSTG